MGGSFFFYCLGLTPLLFLDLLLVSPGVRIGAAGASVLLLPIVLLLGGLLLCTRRLWDLAIPSQLRGTAMAKCALGLSFSIAAALPILMPIRFQWLYLNRVHWNLLFQIVAMLMAYVTLMRFLPKWNPPRHAGRWFLILGILQVGLASVVETMDRTALHRNSGIGSLEDVAEHTQAAPATLEATARERPHVVLLVLDTLRYDTLLETWQGEQHFPQLDAYLAEGTHFERSYAGCNVTPGGHSTLFTGLYPHETGTLSFGMVKLAPSFLSVAEFLRSRGYRTGAAVANSRISGRYGFGQGFEIYNDTLVNPIIDFKSVGDRIAASHLMRAVGARVTRKAVGAVFASLQWRYGDPPAMETTDAALKVLADLERQEEDPAFLFVNYRDPHSPYTTDQSYIDAFGPGYRSRGLEGVRKDVIAFSTRLKRIKDDLQNGVDRSADMRWLQEVYREQCLELDEGVVALLRGLEETGIRRDNTLLIVTSDHGEQLGEHGAFHHGSSLYDEEVRVPLVVMGPGFDAEKVQTPVSGADFLATVATTLGVPAEDLPPTSGVPWQAPQRDRYLVFEHGQYRGFLFNDYKMLAVDRDGALQWTDAYDLSEDPLETQNLIDSGLAWVDAWIENPPLQSSEDAEALVDGDGSIDLAALGYADEAGH
ncbi:MAG: sulfatase [Planctomycetota bacterium]